MNKVTFLLAQGLQRPSGVGGVSGFLSRHGKFEQQVADSLGNPSTGGSVKLLLPASWVERPSLQATAAAKVQNLHTESAVEPG